MSAAPGRRFPWVPKRPGAALRALTYPIDPTEPREHAASPCTLFAPLLSLLSPDASPHNAPAGAAQVKLNTALTSIYPHPLQLHLPLPLHPPWRLLCRAAHHDREFGPCSRKAAHCVLEHQGCRFTPGQCPAPLLLLRCHLPLTELPFLAPSCLPLPTPQVRKLLPESWGFLCPVHTPDGSPCGLLNHLTATCRCASAV